MVRERSSNVNKRAMIFIKKLENLKISKNQRSLYVPGVMEDTENVVWTNEDCRLVQSVCEITKMISKLAQSTVSNYFLAKHGRQH